MSNISKTRRGNEIFKRFSDFLHKLRMVPLRMMFGNDLPPERKMPMTFGDRITKYVLAVISILTFLGLVFCGIALALLLVPSSGDLYITLLFVLGCMLPGIGFYFLYEQWEARWWYKKERLRFREAVERGEAPEFPPLYTDPHTGASSVEPWDLLNSVRGKRHLEALAKIRMR